MFSTHPQVGREVLTSLCCPLRDQLYLGEHVCPARSQGSLGVFGASAPSQGWDRIQGVLSPLCLCLSAQPTPSRVTVTSNAMATLLGRCPEL